MKYSGEFTGKYTKESRYGSFLVNQYFNSINKILIQNIDLNHIKNVHEIGCGGGYSTLEIKKILGPKINFTASEYEKELLPLAKKNNPEIKIFQENVYNMMSKDNAYDLVFALEVLEHLDDYSKALFELRRSSSKYVLLGVPNEPLWRLLNFLRGKYVSDFGNTPGHINHWSTGSFKKLLSESGFSILTFRKPLPWIQVLLEVNK